MKKIIVGLSIATLLVTSSFSYAGISSGGMSRSTISRSVTKPSGGLSMNSIKSMTSSSKPVTSSPPVNSYKSLPNIPNTSSPISQAVPAPRPTTQYSEVTRIRSYDASRNNNQTSGLSPTQTMIGAALVGGVASYVGASMASSNNHSSQQQASPPPQVTAPTVMTQPNPIVVYTKPEPEKTVAQKDDSIGWFAIVIFVLLSAAAIFAIYKANIALSKNNKENKFDSKQKDLHKQLSSFYTKLQKAYVERNLNSVRDYIDPAFFQELEEQLSNDTQSVSLDVCELKVKDIKYYPNNEDGSYFFSVFFTGVQIETNKTNTGETTTDSVIIDDVYNFKSVQTNSSLNEIAFILVGIERAIN